MTLVPFALSFRLNALCRRVSYALLPALVGACGSHEASAEAAGLSPGAAAQEATLMAAESCDFSGTWALKFEIPVTWKGFDKGLESGSGTIVQWALSHRRMADDHHISEEIVPCGSTIPSYHASLGGESYGITFPDALFDGGRLSPIPGRTAVSDRAPGGTFLADPITIEMGVNLPDADTAIWPKEAKTLAGHLVDSDADGNPGVTVQARFDDGLSRPPVNMMRTHRAQEFYLALRDVIGAQGRVVSCDRFEGSTVIPMLGGKPALSSSVVGCRLTTGALCNQAQANLSNRYQPTYRLGDRSRSTMVRLPDQATCAQVRALAF